MSFNAFIVQLNPARYRNIQPGLKTLHVISPLICQIKFTTGAQTIYSLHFSDTTTSLILDYLDIYFWVAQRGFADMQSGWSFHRLYHGVKFS